MMGGVIAGLRYLSGVELGHVSIVMRDIVDNET